MWLREEESGKDHAMTGVSLQENHEEYFPQHNSISRGLMRGVLRSARWWSRIKVPGAWVVFTPVPTARKWIMEKHWPWGDYESCTALRMICGYTVNLPMLPLTIVTVLKREFHWIVGHVRNGIKDISQTVCVFFTIIFTVWVLMLTAIFTSRCLF